MSAAITTLGILLIAEAELSVKPTSSSYVVGQTVMVNGKTSLVTNESVDRDLRRQGKDYILDRTSVAKDGLFAYLFTALESQGTCLHRVVAKYLGSVAEVSFRLERQSAQASSTMPAPAATTVSVTAYSRSSSPSVYIYVKNILADDIYGLSVVMPEEVSLF